MNFILLSLLLLSVFLIFVLFLLGFIFMIYRLIRYLLTTPFNLTISPKAHAFINIRMESSTLYGAVTICIVAMILQKSTILFISANTLHKLFETTGIPTTYLIYIMELLIKDITDIYTSTFNQFNGSGLGFQMLRTIHINLTSYLINYHQVFTLLQKVVGFFAGSPELNQMQDLATRFFDSGRNLLSVYRQIEIVLRISLAASPISTQIWGF